MFISVLIVIAIAAVAFCVFMWSQGSPRVQSFRDDCKNWSSLWRSKGLGEVAKFFDRWPEYREGQTLDAMRERFADFNDPEWFRLNITLPLVKADAKHLLADDANRARVQQALREAGYELTPIATTAATKS